MVHAISGPVVGISILNRLVLSTYVGHLDTMSSNSFSSKMESLSLAFCGTCVSCNIMDLSK